MSVVCYFVIHINISDQNPQYDMIPVVTNFFLAGGDQFFSWNRDAEEKRYATHAEYHILVDMRRWLKSCYEIYGADHI